MEDFDLAIVGASFAGLICARAAATRGLRTIVLESKRHPAARVHTTGILVKEAGEEVDTPPHLTRTVHAVRLYAPSLRSKADPNLLHCFLDLHLARGYLAWVAPAPGFMQVGLATNGAAKPDLAAFLAHTERLFGFSGAIVRERRSGLIPCGGPVTPAGAPNVMLIGDAAGHVSPMTGGGIRLAFRYGRRAGQLIHDHLMRNGPPPEQALAGELPSFALKLAMRRAVDMAPPNWLYDMLIATPAMRWLARRIYFHRRAQPGYDSAPGSPGA